MQHETDFIRYFGHIAWNVGMPEEDFLTVMDSFFKTILPQLHKTRIDGTPWPAWYGPVER
jgi:hypothetical protein